MLCAWVSYNYFKCLFVVGSSAIQVIVKIGFNYYIILNVWNLFVYCKPTVRWIILQRHRKDSDFEEECLTKVYYLSARQVPSCLSCCLRWFQFPHVNTGEIFSYKLETVQWKSDQNNCGVTITISSTTSLKRKKLLIFKVFINRELFYHWVWY